MRSYTKTKQRNNESKTICQMGWQKRPSNMTRFKTQQNYLLQLLKSCSKRAVIVKITKDGPAQIAVRTFTIRELAKYGVPFPFDDIKNTAPAKLKPGIDSYRMTAIIRKAVADYLNYYLEEYKEEILPGQKTIIEAAIDEAHYWIEKILPEFSEDDLYPFDDNADEVDVIRTEDKDIQEALAVLQSFGHTRIRGYEDVERILWDLAYRHMNLSVSMMKAILILTTEIKVKTATKRMFNRYNSLLERNRLAECGVVDVEIRPSYMKIRQHEHEINELRRQLRKTERRVYTEQRTILKPRLNLSKAILRKMRSPRSRFCRSYDFTKEQDIEEYIGWFRTIGLPIQNYIIKELEEQYGQELTLFREKVDEFNMTLTQPDAKNTN